RQRTQTGGCRAVAWHPPVWGVFSPNEESPRGLAPLGPSGITPLFAIRRCLMPDYFTLLRDRVTLKCRSLDRLFFQAYVPKLQSVGQVCIFLRWRRKIQIPSSAAFGKIGDAYVEALYEFAKANGITMVRFEKRQDKEKTAG